ncbi:hypothetical protein HW555_012388 [Spodoptera exigua]|uniref:HTH psq-type domain-containing protein n=1 Tax=Spodoptera exigua TaxID=7107 RepID=A0A835L0R9_SPOEX|nr:hypothetical protein HW555_012388 [Spodoptera exigua]
MDHGIPLNIHARPRLVGRRPNEIVNIETDVFQEKSYKQYSSQHLRDALIAVKKGYSVYAASNKFGVPRKTLRNWMEKYDIKSQFSKGRRGARTQILDPLDLMVESRSEKFEDDFPIANVQCQYDSPSDTEPERGAAVARPTDDHTYDTRDEPPAFIIRHAIQLQSTPNFREARPKIMTIGPGSSASVNVIHVGDQAQGQEMALQCAPQPVELSLNKRIRRSEVVLRQAADCVSRGLTFQTPSRPCNSPEPPFHMQHFKLPDMVALRTDDEEHPTH